MRLSARTRVVFLLSAGLLTACTGSGELPPDSPTPTPLAPTPSPTPYTILNPITLEDGIFTLWNLYVFPRALGDGEEPYILEPGGEVQLDSGILIGTLSWTVYASRADFTADPPVPLCSYAQSLEGAPDTDIAPSPDCEHCGVYYRVVLSPPATTDCDADAVLALLDTNGDGKISTAETSPQDYWAFSPTDDDGWPSAWTETSSWTKLEEYFTCWGTPYAAWSFQWSPVDQDYIPLYALVRPIPDPMPDTCPYQ